MPVTVFVRNVSFACARPLRILSGRLRLNITKIWFFTASKLSNPCRKEPLANDVLECLTNGGELLPRLHAKSVELYERCKGSIVAFDERVETPQY